MRLDAQCSLPFTSLLILAACSSTEGPPLTGPATRLTFTVQPAQLWSADVTTNSAPQVAIQDSLGNTVAGATNTVTLSLGANPGGSTLTGTLTETAVNGVATFPLLHIDRSGTGYTLVATSGALVRATSAPFTVRLNLIAVSAGGGFTCGVTQIGTAYCWGDNFFGELGTGTNPGPQQCGFAGQLACSTSPVPVTGGIHFVFTVGGSIPSVSAGADHACGVSPGGATYCWGFGTYGQLGAGDTTTRATPVPVSSSMMFAAVSAGNAFTCGVTSSHVAYCWGLNFDGQLGVGTSTGPQLCNGNASACSTTPVALAGGLDFAAVSAGAFHACGLTTGGAAYCWGNNGLGALGNGTTVSSATPVPVSGALTFAAVSAGRYFTCGVTSGGAAYCWGDNSSGQLGDGTTTQRLSPVLVAGGMTFVGGVSVGSNHACGLDTNGLAYCWGLNSNGQLGDGTLTNRASPTLVATRYVGLNGLGTVSAGMTHTCAVSFQSLVFCWGDNFQGELGDGTTNPSMVPVRVVQ